MSPAIDKRDGIITLLVVALGGQGGNLFRDWLTHAAREAGWVVQTTAVVGGAQRAGPTQFYVEMAPPRSATTEPPAFSLFATPGEVDVVVAQELLELGRALEAGFGGPSTTIITNTDRVFATAEKLATGDGRASSEEILAMARRLSGRLVEVAAGRIARDAGLPPVTLNAVLLGALCESRGLPFEAAAYESAIQRVGVAASLNLAAFRAGAAATSAGLDGAEAVGEVRRQPAQTVPAGELDSARRAFPQAVHETMELALAQLVGYQSPAYARRYLAELDSIRALDSDEDGWRLLDTVMRTLATRMTYEDAARVAELKARRERFERLRREHEIAPGQVYRVVDYLDPHPDEIYGLLPTALANPIHRLDAAVTTHLLHGRRPSTPMRIVTSSAWGLGLMRLLALPRRWRQHSWRFGQEWELISAWLEDVRMCARVDVEIAREVAEAGNLVKGYGDTRERTIGVYREFRTRIVVPVLDVASAEPDLARRLVRRCREAAARDDSGIADAADLASAVLDLLRQGDRDRAAARVRTWHDGAAPLRPLPLVGRAAS